MIFLLQVLFPYIVLFYVVDCIVHIKKFHIAFSSHFGRKFKLKRRGVRFIGFSPFCKFYQAINFPFFVSEKGVYLWNKVDIDDCDLYEQKHFDLILFKDLEKVESDGAALKINDSRNIRLSSSTIANYLAEKIDHLKNCSPESRNLEYKDLFDSPEEIKETKNKYLSHFFLIQLLGTVLFINTFLFLPGFLYLNLALRFQFIISIIVLFYILTFGSSLYIHNKVCKDTNKKVLFLLTLIFSPVSSIHSIHIITKDMSFSFDWIALSAYLLPRKDFKDILVNELKRIHFSKGKCRDTDLMSFLLFKEKQYLPFLHHVGLNYDEIFVKSASTDSSAYCYCPFCEAGFQKGVDTCPDCDINLSKYDMK